MNPEALAAKHTRAELVDIALTLGVPISGPKYTIAERIAAARDDPDPQDDHGDQGDAFVAEETAQAADATDAGPFAIPADVDVTIPAYSVPNRYRTVTITIPARTIRGLGIPERVTVTAAAQAVTELHQQGYAHARRPRRTSTTRDTNGDLMLTYEVAVAPPRRVGRR